MPRSTFAESDAILTSRRFLSPASCRKPARASHYLFGRGGEAQCGNDRLYVWCLQLVTDHYRIVL